MEISNLPNKEFKIMVINMLTDLRRRINEHNEKLQKIDKKYMKVPKKSHRVEEYSN